MQKPIPQQLVILARLPPPWIAALILLIAWRFAAAVSYPDYQSITVNDFAGLLSPQQHQSVTSKLQQLKQQHGVEMTVVTILQRSDYGYRGAIEPFATGLFNHWGVGDAGRDDGVMLLVSKNDRDMRFELGSGFPLSRNSDMKRIIDEVIIPRFKQGRFGDGIEAGVTEAIRVLTVSPHSGSQGSGQALVDSDRLIPSGDRTDPGSSSPKLEPDSTSQDDSFEVTWWMALLAGIPGAGFVVFYVRRYLRRRPRDCPVCQAAMVRLSENAEDVYLDESSQMEESIRSVDYDVWKCHACEHMTIKRYPAWFSKYGACRQCQARTLESDSRIISAATYTTTGQRRIDYHCVHCDHQFYEYATIPMKTRSSSSSSSSFGGGSSSGGGASGSW